jgi:hypothetical protein
MCTYASIPNNFSAKIYEDGTLTAKLIYISHIPVWVTVDSISIPCDMAIRVTLPSGSTTEEVLVFRDIPQEDIPVTPIAWKAMQRLQTVASAISAIPPKSAYSSVTVGVYSHTGIAAVHTQICREQEITQNRREWTPLQHWTLSTEPPLAECIVGLPKNVTMRITCL